MRIGVDVDSVLNDLDESWAAWVRAHYEPDYDVSWVKSWDTHKYTRAGKAVYDFLKLPGVFRTLPVRAGAVDGMRAIQASGHELFVVTSAIPSTWGDKAEWLIENFPFIPEANFIVCHRKGVCDLDVLVDDGLHNFAEFKGYGIVFDRPWNRAAPAHLERARDWADVVKLIHGRTQWLSL